MPSWEVKETFPGREGGQEGKKRNTTHEIKDQHLKHEKAVSL